MSNLFLLRNNENKWEEVTAYVYENRQFALTDENEPRYDGAAVVAHDNVVNFHGTIGQHELGPICRMLGATIPVGSLGQGAIQAPQTIKFRKRNQTILHTLATGENWVKKS